MLLFLVFSNTKGPSLSWSYGSWIYNYLWNQCLWPLKLCAWTPFMARCIRYNIKWQSSTGRWFYPGTPVSSTNKTDRIDITEILLNVVLDTIHEPYTTASNTRNLLLFTNYSPTIHHLLQHQKLASVHQLFTIHTPPPPTPETCFCSLLLRFNDLSVG